MATRTKSLPPAHRKSVSRNVSVQSESGLRQFNRAARGYLFFLVAVVGGAWYLQSTLVLFHAADVYVHWGAILLVIPLFVGYILRVTKTPYSGWVLVIGALSAVSILYPWYHDYWLEPPPLWAAGVYAAITAGVASIPLLPFKRLGESLWHYLAYRRKAKRRAGFSSGREPLFGSAKYSATVDTLQLVIAIASLLISLISIGVLAMP